MACFQGIVDGGGHGPNDGRYVLTAAGEELRPVVEALGVWGVRWIGELGDADLDPKLLLWDMHRNVNDSAVRSAVHSAVQAGPAVVRFRFPDAPPRTRDWWLVIRADDVDVCDDDPEQPVAVAITADPAHDGAGLARRLRLSAALGTGRVRIEGPEQLGRAVPSWFALSPFAAVPRP